MNTARIVPLAAILGAAPAALAQAYSTGFEAPTFAASPAGVSLTGGAGGQDGWYNPGLGSADAAVHTYTGNPYTFTPPPGGADQFVAGRAIVGAPTRSQRDCAFAAGAWSATWNMSARYTGTLPSAPNLGSFSLQPYGTSRSWQSLHNWFNVASPTTWRCAFLPYDAAGFEAPFPGVLSSPAWDGLLPGAWYRVRVTWSFTTNTINTLSITDLASGVTTTDTPAGWYLAGGASPALPIATAYRFFTGGAAGNVMAWDNFSVAPACYPDCNTDGVLNLGDFGCFQTKFALGDPYADCNADGVLNLGDFGCFQTRFALGCP